MQGTPSGTWIITAIFVAIFAALLAGAFAPLAGCPACDDWRLDLAAAGIDVDGIRQSGTPCNLCGEGKKVSWLKYWKYKSALHT